MATLQIQATAVCAGGEHITVRGNLDAGALIRASVLSVAAITTPLANQEIDDVLLLLVRLHARGKTTAQLKTDLTTGFTVTL